MKTLVALGVLLFAYMLFRAYKYNECSKTKGQRCGAFGKTSCSFFMGSKCKNIELTEEEIEIILPK